MADPYNLNIHHQHTGTVSEYGGSISHMSHGRASSAHAMSTERIPNSYAAPMANLEPALPYQIMP